MAEKNDTSEHTSRSEAPPQIPDGQWMPETVLSSLKDLPEQDSTSPLPFFHLLERLKTTKREGWRRFGISQGESIADHMYRMAIITMVAPASLASKLDLNRCTKMALVHDMAESLVGDITPKDGVSKPEKNRREAATMEYLCKTLLGNVDGGSAGQHIHELWQEYEDSKTPESIFVHDIDKVELLLQMVDYEKTRKGRDSLIEFAYVVKKIETPEVKAWSMQLLEEEYKILKERDGSADDFDDIPSDHKKALDDYYDK